MNFDYQIEMIFQESQTHLFNSIYLSTMTIIIILFIFAFIQQISKF